MTKRVLTEDWSVVVLGFLLILLAIAGFAAPIPTYQWDSAGGLLHSVLSSKNLFRIFYQFAYVTLFAFLGNILTGQGAKTILVVFPFVYILTILALITAGSQVVRSLNLEAVILSLSLGLLISNVFTLPSWFRSALKAEYFVKIGLILLGTTVLFPELLKAGSLGLIQALVVVLSVWYFAFWVCKRLGIDREMSLMLSSAVSICGVSAAIATSGAIEGDSKNYPTSFRSFSLRPFP
ncbi:MAG: putative sulfate exporter family transporter [Siphonobacter sp.]